MPVQSEVQKTLLNAVYFFYKKSPFQRFFLKENPIFLFEIIINTINRLFYLKKLSFFEEKIDNFWKSSLKMPLFVGKNTGIRRVSGWGFELDYISHIDFVIVFEQDLTEDSNSIII